MTLYSGIDPSATDAGSCSTKKGMDFEIIDVDLLLQSRVPRRHEPADPHPGVVERDLVLYESNIINEYIDERFPHPQLMPATR